MQSALQKLAQDANVASQNERGFLRCAVESESPPVLAFEFIGPVEAQLFLERRVAISQTTGLRYSIPANRQSTVLEHR
jgi:hypothetical protein